MQNSKAFIDQRKYNILVACLLGLIPTLPLAKTSNFHEKWVYYLLDMKLKASQNLGWVRVTDIFSTQKIILSYFRLIIINWKCAFS